MANNKLPYGNVNPSRLSDSATFTIGGKSYKSQDIHTVGGSENTPRPVDKSFDNLSGAVHTSAEYRVSDSVHFQGGAYKPSDNTHATVQTSSAYKPRVSVPVNSVSSNSGDFASDWVGEDAELSADGSVAYEAERRAVEQPTEYYADSSFDAEMTEVASQVEEIPNLVGGVDTADAIEVVADAVTNPQELNVGAVGASVPTPVAVGESVLPTVGVGDASSLVLPQEQITEIKLNLARMRLSDKVSTDKFDSNQEVAKMFTLTGKGLEKARESKELADRFSDGTATTREFIKGLGKVASITVSTEAVKAFEDWKNAPKKNELLSSGKLLLGNAEGSLMSDDDLGDQSAGGVIGAGIGGYSAFKLSQKATEIGVESVKSVGNGIYQVSTTAGRATITVAKTAKVLIEKQVVPFSKDGIKILRDQANISGLTNTAIVKNIVNKVNVVRDKFTAAKASIVKAKDYVVSAARAVKKAAESTVRVVHGVATGQMTVDAAKASFTAFRNKAVTGIKTGFVKGARAAAGYAVRGVSQGASVAVFRGVPTTLKFSERGLITGAGMMMASDDESVRSLGNTITTADVGVKTTWQGAKTTGKATGYTVKTAVKSGKAVYDGAKFIKNHGLKAAWSEGRKKLATAAANAGKSVVTAIIEGVKALGMKFAVPLLLIVCVGAAAMSMMGAPTAAVASIFGGSFDAKDSQVTHDIRDYVSDPIIGVPAMSARYKQNLADAMANAAHNYDIIRFYSASNVGVVVEPTLAGITSVFLPDEELINMLQPMFNAIIVMEYDIEPTEAEAQTLLRTLFNGLFRATTATSIEWCGQALDDGSGEAEEPHRYCGEVHALYDCPNIISGTHTDYTCYSCCDNYWLCRGHEYEPNCGYAEHEHDIFCYSTDENGDEVLSCDLVEHIHDPWLIDYDTGCYSTIYCSDTRMYYDCGNADDYFECTGYEYCGSHAVASYTLTLDGAYALEARYFTDPINRLSSIAHRTSDEEKQLQELKDYHEIYLEMMSQVSQLYGGLSWADLAGVQFVNGTRVPNQDVISLALSQVGQLGGQPYWSYYGFGSRVEWCACFVHWCMRNTPSATSKYPTTANNAYCPTIAEHFMDMGQWGNRAYTDLVAGDTIFFDWQGDGVVDHIGLVIGTDGTCVYTVEGNSGDAVKINSYLIGSPVIYGYGLMNY